MALTFLERVNALTQLEIGSATTPTNQDHVSEFLEDGAKDVILRALKSFPEEAHLFSEKAEDVSNAGALIENALVTSVYRDDVVEGIRPASPIEAGLQKLATVTSSLHYKSIYNPGYYIEDSKVFVVPISTGDSKGIVSFVKYPDVTHAQTTINNPFPDKYEYLVILYAAVECLNTKIASLAAMTDVTTEKNKDDIEMAELVIARQKESVAEYTQAYKLLYNKYTTAFVKSQAPRSRRRAAAQEPTDEMAA